jgi:hypothetical protein
MSFELKKFWGQFISYLDQMKENNKLTGFHAQNLRTKAKMSWVNFFEMYVPVDVWCFDKYLLLCSRSNLNRNIQLTQMTRTACQFLHAPNHLTVGEVTSQLKASPPVSGESDTEIDKSGDGKFMI